RKVVLATNVAETSITIDGVTGVVDSGLARTLRFEPAVGLNRLELGRISQASAEQRTGRAGRTAPGTCLRLWTAAEQHLLAAEEVPEILRVDLAAAVLQLACWGETELADFHWLQSPPPASIESAIALLQPLGAVADRRPTELGRLMARLPVHPRLARLLVEGARLGHPRRTALAAALLSERDPFRRAPGGRRTSQHRSDSDVLDRLTALEDFERRAGPGSDLAPLDPGAARATLRARDQLLRLLEGQVPTGDSRACDPDEAVMRALLMAYPDRVARRREPAGRRALLVGGRGVRLADESAVGEAEWFVCVEINEVGQGEALVRQASAIERDWLPADRVTSGIDVQFDSQRERVIAWRRTRYADLVIGESPTSIPPEIDPGAILAAAILDRFGDEWPLSDEESAFLARVELLRQAMPDLELPEISGRPIAAWLPELCSGQVSMADVRKQSLLGVWKSHFTAAQLQAIDRDAPERLRVPSGSLVALHYELGKPPVLAVRIQEVFGWRQTPRIAGQRVRVLLHLLAPNMRPQQITDDLESFWTNTYSQVRKDLRRRYPKHAWPEDPWTAQPEHRPRSNRRS
ncbi:MAG TPA: ATP-dependent helicase C-terminal domain-containing protein, partial [Pirellulales bacterium]